MLTTSLQKDIKTQPSTIHFVFMSFITMHIYAIVWQIRFLDVLYSKYNLPKRIFKSAHFRLFTSIIIASFILIPIGNVYVEPIFYLINNTLGQGYVRGLTGLIIALIIFLIIIGISLTLQFRKILILLFKQHSIHRKVNLFWTLIFHIFYIYYVIHNLDPEDEPIQIEYFPEKIK